MSLADLEKRIRYELSFLEFPSRPWMRSRTSSRGHVYDVVIVGAGQSGLAAAYGLIREQVKNILVVDRRPAGTEGPWKTYARMITLRTPKTVSGLDFGNPSLTPRAWFEAQWGARRLGQARQDSARYVAGLSRLVSPCARAAGRK